MATAKEYVLVRIPADGRRIAKRYAAMAELSMTDWLFEAIVQLGRTQEKEGYEAETARRERRAAREAEWSAANDEINGR